jgi:hypothetical protein
VPRGAVPQSWSTLGTLCIVLSIGQLLWFLYTVGAAAVTLAMFRYTSGMLGSAGAGAAMPELQQIIDSLESFARTQALWEIGRSVPFAGCSVALLVIGAGIAKGRRESLLAARTWVWVALVVVTLSLCVQIFVTVPATLEYQRLTMQKMQAMTGIRPTGAKSPFGELGVYNIVMSVIVPLGWSVILAGWPVVLRVWADKLLRADPAA